MKKKLIVLVILVLIIAFAIFLFTRKKDYEIKYEKNGLDIIERYYDNKGIYVLSTKHDKKTYDIAITNKYIGKGIVDDIKVISDDSVTCIIFVSKKFDTYPICTDSKKYISYNLVKDLPIDEFKLKKNKTTSKKYNNIEVNTLNGESILIWNHHGFSYIDRDGKTDLNIFKDEIYQDNNSFQISNYILIPNYDQKYEFSKFYIINMTTKEVDTIDLEQKISFNYYYMGAYDDIGYIFDKKNSIQYLINPKKKTVEKVGDNTYGKVWRDKWEEVSLVKLKNDKYTFYTENAFNYYIKDNNLYFKNYKSNIEVAVYKNADNIIYTKDDKVYFTYNDRIISISPYYEEYTLLEYDEIVFNKGLSIYIY